MAEITNLEKLAADLPLDERHDLLDKLKGLSNISNEPLYVQDSESAHLDASEVKYAKLPWYFRFWYFILSLFKDKSPIRVFEDHQVAELGNRVEEKSPGLFDYENGLLLSAFLWQMQRLKEASRFFYSALDTSVNRDRGAFFAFMGSLEMPDIHKRLQAETDPKTIVEKHPNTPEMDLRQMALRIMDDILNNVPDDYKSKMYFDARTLNCLKELSSFLFDRVIMSFGHNVAINSEACTANVVKELLIFLDNILNSLLIVPPMSLLESLFIFILQERSGEKGFDLTREIKGLLVKAEDSLEVIRDFNKQVPLTWIIRCASRDMTFSPRQISGGEDWFVVYRDYWKRRIETLFSNFMRDRRYRDLLESFRFYLKGSSLKTLTNTQSDSNPDGLPIKGAFALSFLLTFYSVVFIPDINKILRPILIEAEFQKKENRAEFAESYNNLIKLEDDINTYEQEIDPSGDFGGRYAQARHEMSSLTVKRKKIQIVVDEASKAAGEIILHTREAARNMMDILNGVLGRDITGKYEPLTNFVRFSGRSAKFNADLEDVIQQFQRFLKLMDDIDTMETGR